jgi:hypothetical protein
MEDQRMEGKSTCLLVRRMFSLLDENYGVYRHP